VRLAIFADIHANRQAFSACLAFARARGAERIVCLGDIVGYGADPEWAVDTVMGLVDDGAIAVIGNHDHAISTPSENMNAVAQTALSGGPPETAELFALWNALEHNFSRPQWQAASASGADASEIFPFEGKAEQVRQSAVQMSQGHRFDIIIKK
jgi:calcineurin-like phosphoesterase family protein